MKIEKSDFLPPEELKIEAALRARFSEVPDVRWQELLRCLFNTSIKNSLYPVQGKLLDNAINKGDTWARLLGEISTSDPDRVTGLRLEIRRPEESNKYYSMALFNPDRGESDAPGQVEAVFLMHGKRVTRCDLRGRAPVTTGPEGQVLGVGFGLSVRTETNEGIRRLSPDPQLDEGTSRDRQLFLVPYSQALEGRPTKLAKLSMQHGSGPVYQFEISSKVFGLPFFSRGVELRAESADDHVGNGLDGFFEDALRANAGRLGVDIGKIGLLGLPE